MLQTTKGEILDTLLWTGRTLEAHPQTIFITDKQLSLYILAYSPFTLQGLLIYRGTFLNQDRVWIVLVAHEPPKRETFKFRS